MRSYDSTDDWDAGDWAEHMGGPDEPVPELSLGEYEMEAPPEPEPPELIGPTRPLVLIDDSIDLVDDPTIPF